MATEDVKRSESAAVSTIVNLAEEAREGVKAPSYAVLSICKSLCAGGVAGGVSRTAVAPLERMKILLQVQNPHNIKYSGTVQGLKYIWRTEGLRGLFKGNGTNCARIVPNSAVKFFSYEQASKGILYMYRQQTGNENAQLTPVLRLGAGATAGIIAMSATYPMDMVRGRLTVQTANSPYQYRGIAHALSTVVREEGPRALYRGWLPSVIGVIPQDKGTTYTTSEADQATEDHHEVSYVNGQGWQFKNYHPNPNVGKNPHMFNNLKPDGNAENAQGNQVQNKQPTVVVRPAAEPVPTRDYVPKVLYPVPAKATRKDKEEMKCRKMLEDLTVRLPLMSAIQMMSSMSSFVKGLISGKINDDSEFMVVSKECSAVLQNKKIKKL
ncbi:hypothetical protein F2Q70_00016638, partial [Brassica cretica]